MLFMESIFMDTIFCSLNPVIAFLDIGGGEFIFILLVALILFGGKLPDVARNVGRTVGTLKRQADDLTREFRDEFHESSRPHQPPKRYDPPPRVVPTRDDRSLRGDESSDDHGGDSGEDDADELDDGMIHAPEEEMKRADDASFHQPLHGEEFPEPRDHAKHDPDDIPAGNDPESPDGIDKPGRSSSDPTSDDSSPSS